MEGSETLFEVRIPCATKVMQAQWLSTFFHFSFINHRLRYSVHISWSSLACNLPLSPAEPVPAFLVFFVICLLVFCSVFAALRGLRDLSSLTRDQTLALGSESAES